MNDYFLEQYLDYLKNRLNYSDYTIKNYRIDIRQLLDYSDCKADAISEKTVKSYFRSISSQYKSRSYNRKLISIRNFFNYLVEQAAIKNNPTNKIPGQKTDTRLPNYISDNKMRKLLDSIYESNFSSSRESLILEIFYCCGMRLSELYSLMEKNFHFDNKTVRFRGKGNKERVVPISEYVIEKYHSYMDFRKIILQDNNKISDYIFISQRGDHLSKRQIQRIIKQLLQKIAHQGKSSPHVIRHTFATHLLNNGADIFSIKELLGHESISTTSIYSHISTTELKNIYNKAHPKS